MDSCRTQLHWIYLQSLAEWMVCTDYYKLTCVCPQTFTLQTNSQPSWLHTAQLPSLHCLQSQSRLLGVPVPLLALEQILLSCTSMYSHKHSYIKYNYCSWKHNQNYGGFVVLITKVSESATTYIDRQLGENLNKITKSSTSHCPKMPSFTTYRTNQAAKLWRGLYVNPKTSSSSLKIFMFVHYPLLRTFLSKAAWLAKGSSDSQQAAQRQ